MVTVYTQINEDIYEEIFGDYLIEEIYKLFITETSLSYLNELHCKSDDDPTFFYELSQYLSIFDQYTIKHAYNIIYLSIIIDKDIVFLNNLLPKLINLKSLSLDGCLFNKFDEQLNFSSSYYPKLQVLKLNSIYYSTAIKLLRKLMKIFRKFIQIFFQYCPNLKYVKIVLTEQDL
ncbi:hypothetical protein C1645_818293 [Glomus cerebriforme]|uniref:F-box domain-containing protein n=1 Tax=Glomus cerebriforme TaxID=658196 RepID=A0A397T8T3_9GLOM|nr:hypothetical protein C1645_818293 [Glomus cerebriforme]